MPVDLKIEGAVAKVILNRPERLNALTDSMRRNSASSSNQAGMGSTLPGGSRCRPGGVEA